MPVRLGIGISIIILFCSLAIFSFLSSRSICIESALIENLEMVQIDKTLTAQQCGRKDRTEYQDDLAKLAEEVNRRMVKIDYAVNQIGVWRSTFQLTVIDSDTPLVRQVERHLVIDRQSFFRGTDFERAVWDYWLIDTLGVTVEATRHALSSVLLYASNGEGTELQLDNLRSTFLSQAFLEGFKQLSNKERLEFLKTFANTVGFLTARFSESNNLAVVLAELSEFSASLSLVKSADVSPAFFKFLTGVIAYQDTQGWRGKGLHLQQVLVAGDVTPKVLESYGFDKVGINTPLLVSDGKTHRILPSTQLLAGTIPSTVSAFRGVWIHCDPVTFAQIRKFPARVSKLLVLGCNKNLPQFKNFLRKEDILEFAKDNLTLPFLDVHMGSFNKVKSYGESRPFELLIHPGKHPFFKEVGWLEPIFDQKRSVYRAQSSIEVFQYYRTPQ